MASTVFTDKVTMVPADWANDVNALTYDVFAGAQTVADALTALGLSWAVQNNLHATITGGSINGVPIGVSAPNAGHFTSLTATTQGIGTNDVALVPFVTSAVAALQATLGTIATQDADAVAITGGSIEHTPIGLSTPAAAAFTKVTVTAAPVAGTDLANKAYVDAQITGLPNWGSLALQNANAVTISGGTIDNTVIGGTTPAEAFFLSMGVTNMLGSTGALYLDASLANYFQYGAMLTAKNSTPNIGIKLGSTGAFVLQNSAAANLLQVTPQGRVVVNTSDDGVNYIQIAGGARFDQALLSSAITQPNQATTKLYVDTVGANVAAGVQAQITAAINLLGSMAQQNATAVAITGGNIDGTVIGGSTPAAGTFTTLGAQTVGNANGKALFNQTASQDAVVLQAPLSNNPNVSVWLNTGGAFRVVNGPTTVAKINAAGRMLIGTGTDDAQSLLQVFGQVAFAGQAIAPTAPAGPTSLTNKAYVDAQIAAATGSTVTPQYVQDSITAALVPYATTAYVNNAVAGLVNQAYVTNAINNALANYATTTYVNSQITSALTPYATQTYVNNAITSALATYATQAFVTSQLANYATQAYVATQLASYVLASTLSASTGATQIGYGLSTVQAALDGFAGVQNANQVYAGPASGAAAAPTFRALTSADLPTSLTLTALTVGSITASGPITFTGTDAIKIPAGSTAQRPASPSQGMIRRNTDTSLFEFYDGSTWLSYLALTGGTVTGSLAVQATVTANGLLPGGVGYDIGSTTQQFQNLFLAGVVSNAGYNGAAPATGTTVTIGAETATQFVDPAATIAALTVALPTALADGDTRTIVFGKAVTALTLTTPAGTIDANWTNGGTQAAGSTLKFMWRNDTTTWRLIGKA